MFQGLMVDLEIHDELKSWLKSTYDRVLLYVTSGNGLTYDDKIVTDVLKLWSIQVWLLDMTVVRKMLVGVNREK